jgi:hypothetical protein
MGPLALYVMANDAFVVDLGFDKLNAELMKLDGIVIKVGIQSDADAIQAEDEKGRPQEITLLDKAIYNEFGHSGKKDTADAGHGSIELPSEIGSVVLPSFELGGQKGNGGAAPARPFVSGWADTFQAEIYRNQEAVYLAVLEGKYDAARGAGLLGEWAQGSMKKNLRDFAWAPNAPATIKAKGSDKPLIDVSQMINAIRYLVASKELTAS